MRTILITGASRGIGRAIAERCFLEGHNISLGIRNTNNILGTILDPQVSGPERINISNYDSLESHTAKTWVQKSISKFKKIDTVIHCAGIFDDVGILLEGNSEKRVRKLLDVNLMGPWILNREPWKYLAESKSGRIIVLVSMSGKRSKSNLAGYSVSKFALMGLCQTLRNEGWDKDIRVTAICPGWVNTEMASNINVLDKKLMTQPEDISSIITNLIKLPKSCIPFEICLNCNLEV